MFRQLKGALFLVLGLGVILVPIGVYLLVTRPDQSPLFSDLHGPRTPRGELIIDPRDGTFAGLRLGMTFAKAQTRLPSHRQCASLPPSSLSYCDGTGLTVTIVSACGLMVSTTARCPASSQTGPLAGIEISASTGDEFPDMGYAIRVSVPGSQLAATTEDVRFGDSLKRLRLRYVLTSETPFGAGLCEGFGTSYTAVVGDNTAVFNIEGGALTMISLYPGREPRLCTGP